MFSSALNFLLVTIFNLLTMLFLLRFLLQLFRAPFNNPLAYMVVSLTDFAVKPVRRIIPSWGKIDLSTLFLALLAQFLLQLSLLWLRDFPLSVAGQSAWARPNRHELSRRVAYYARCVFLRHYVASDFKLGKPAHTHCQCAQQSHKANIGTNSANITDGKRHRFFSHRCADFFANAECFCDKNTRNAITITFLKFKLPI